MNLFNDRYKIADEYTKWLLVNPEVKDCAFSVISFLEGRGLLKDIKDNNSNKINSNIK